jgi:glycosyltransferase involved in cell wall biosynthesis
MNILLINHYAGSSRHGMEYRPYYLAREWVRLGHTVTIAAGSHSHLRMQNPDFEGQVSEEDIEGIRYVWLKTPPYEGNGVGRTLNMFAFLRQLTRHKRQLVANGKPDVVIASSTYPMDTIPAYRFAKGWGAKKVFELHDLWPLSPIELGGMSPRHPFIMMVQYAENFACRKADCVVSMLPKAEEHLRGHGLGAGKFYYVPNGINTEEWDNQEPLPKEHSEVLARLRSEGRFLVGYAGAHGLANTLDWLIDAAQHLKSEGATFVLVGKGPDKEALQQRTQALGLNNVVFMPAIPKPAIPSFLAEMDALYIGFHKKPIYRFGISPNKLMDYMMAAKPVISAIEAGNDVVAESGCGLSIPAENPKRIAEAVVELMGLSPAQREEMGLRGQKFLLANYDNRILAKRFLDAIQ